MAIQPVNRNVDFSIISPEQIRLKLEELNKDPIKHYKQLTMLLETNNPLSQSESGMQYLRTLRNGLSVTPEQIEQTFALPQINEQSQQRLQSLSNRQLEDAYRNLYTDYSYGENNIAKEGQRQALSIMRQEISNRNLKPDEVIRNRTPVGQVFNFLGNVFSVPSNIIGNVTSKVVTGDWGKV